MDTNWRQRVRQIGNSVPEASERVRQRLEQSAPEFSKGVQKFRWSSPEVSSMSGRVMPAPPEPLDDQHNAMRPFPPSDPPSAKGSMTRSANPSYSVSPITPAAPTAVHIAYIALMAAAVTAVVLAGLGIYGLTELRGSADKFLHLDPTGTATQYAAGYVKDAEVWLTSTAVALGVLCALAYVLIGHAVRRGRSWPRPVGTFLAILSLPAIFLGPVAVVAVFAGIVAAFATWTPSARQYAKQSKLARRPARYL